MQTNMLAGVQTEGNQGGWFPAGFFAKPTACLPPSGVMKESIISTPS